MSRSQWAHLACILVTCWRGILLVGEEVMHPHLPEEYRPFRPLPIRAINALGRAVGPQTLVPLDAASLKKAACAAVRSSGAKNTGTGVCNFASNSLFEAGLSKLVESLRADAQLTALGHVVFSGQITMLLQNRIKVAEYRAANLARVQAVPVTRPIFIVGLPRTGTTFLLNLLSQDPNLRAPLHWELMDPVPVPRAGGAADGAPDDGDARAAAIQALLDQYKQLAPGLDKWHPLDARMPEEDVVVLGQAFSSVMFQVRHAATSQRSTILFAADAGAGAIPFHHSSRGMEMHTLAHARSR
jgi:hypothetical protein